MDTYSFTTSTKNINTYHVTVEGYNQTFCPTMWRPLPIECYTYSYTKN